MSFETVFLKSERRSVAVLASIFSLRMLGLFMILPVFAVYAEQLSGTTPALIGLALGIYGGFQAIFQTPLGYISDRLGRKPVIVLGLLIFSLGSIVAAMSDSIMGVIIGRSLQGMGAVGSVILALLSDLTRDDVRLKAMAIIGVSIGGSFGLAFIFGPLVAAWVGVSGIFWLIALLSLSAIVVLFFGCPEEKKYLEVSPVQARTNKLSLLSSQMLAIYFGVFVIHACLTAFFLKLPVALLNFMPESMQALKFYLPIFLASVLSAFLCLSFLDKANTLKYHKALLPIVLVLLTAMVILFLSMHTLFDVLSSQTFTSDTLSRLSGGLMSSGIIFGLYLGLYLFFTAFNLLEASLPSYLSKKVPSEHKGSALGIFSSLQFLGLCLGGIVGGWLDAQYGLLAVFLFCVILALVWVLWLIGLTFFSLEHNEV